MGWLSKLNEAYDCGILSPHSQDTKVELIPVGFTEKEIKYHIMLNRHGEFEMAEEFPAKTFLMVPTSPKAESRTGDNGTPYPLADQLKYLVCHEQYPNPRFDNYMKALEMWCQESDAPDCLKILYSYLEKKTLLEDLTSKGCLKVKYGKESEYDGNGSDAKSFIIFSVHTDEKQDALWQREDVKRSWSRYISETASEKQKLCYVEGKMIPAVDNHPKVRGNAKLISSKDAEFPFLYKGRFIEDGSSVSVGYEISAKAHNALNWLMSKQGFSRYGMMLVAWNTNGMEMHVPNEESDYDDDDEEEIMPPDTFESFGKAVRDSLDGYRKDLETFDPERVNEVVILGMEAATDGRMSITYYQEIPGNNYVDRLQHWKLSCCWERYNWKNKKTMVFTPTIRQIVTAVVGKANMKIADADSKCEKSITKKVRSMQMQLLMCIAQERPLPMDILHSIYNQSVSPLSFTSGADNKWSEIEWRNCITIVCALIRRELMERPGEKGVFDAAVQHNCRNRDYLYGRLLAIADYVEYTAQGNQKGLQTSAIRLMQKYVQVPYRTWIHLHNKLIPYFGKIGKDSAYYQSEIGKIESLFHEKDRMKEGPLTELFILGYYSQRQACFYLKETNCAAFVYEKFSNNSSELYGKLTAVAEWTELTATKWEHAGNTNALHMMNQMIQNPLMTWKRLHNKTIPYLEQLGKKGEYCQKLLAQIEKQFTYELRINAAPLNSCFLHGYYQALYMLNKRLNLKEAVVCSENVLNDRNIVYGKLLGLENLVERQVMDLVQGKDTENYRVSNAIRYMAIFGQRPYSTWKKIKKQMAPYQRRFITDAYMEQLELYESVLEQNGWDTDEPLDGSYLHGFYCYRYK